MQAKFGHDKFYSFYRFFLRRLFHEGLNQKEPRSKELDQLLGKIPYLNGGFFDYHEIEEKYNAIAIPDEAFENVFQFFDQFEWHLDDRPLQNDKEINPDVLGYIFEKYINQKDMGAYYTKEDITEYISKNTIIPFLFDKAKEKCKIAFEGERTVWDLLQDDPDRYFYDAVLKGVNGTQINADLQDKLKTIDIETANYTKTNEIEKETLKQLPKNIAIGLDSEKPNLLDRRKVWNTKTPEEFALPTEIWRETIARWQRYFEVRQKIENGEVRSINDLITYNLNIRQFAQDVIESWEGPELIRAIYNAITKITVLDPTVGSGAFLFAALNILEPLYEACLDRMQNFVDELPLDANKSKFSDFKDILTNIEKHPNRQYYIYKSIIINNLYGVDIMDEAVEICKLRLFLKLVAQVDTAEKIEPLPDIDFNIRAGNTLVGFAKHEEVEKAVTKTFDFDNNLGKITDKAEDVQALYDVFLEAQMEDDDSTVDFKQELRKKLDELNNTLNHYLAGEYGITSTGSATNKEKYDNWLKTHQPFHWFVEFYGILAKGGFDVIIGNPPYIEYSKVRKEYKILNYKTEKCGNLYAFCMERSFKLIKANSLIGMIIPISSICTDRMKPYINLISKYISWNSLYAERPSKLFEGAEVQLTISIIRKSEENALFTTRYNKWESVFREHLLNSINYIDSNQFVRKGSIPKIGSKIEVNILVNISKVKTTLNLYRTTKTTSYVSYRNAGGRYYKISLNYEPNFFVNGKEKRSSTYNFLYFNNENNKNKICSTMNSTIFFWYWLVFSDTWHMIHREIDSFPIDLENSSLSQLPDLTTTLMDSYNQNSIYRKEKRNKGKDIVEFTQFKARKSKHIIDEIDKVLAEHYGFTEEELDFIINYDIKYRMGKELNG